MGKFAFRAQTAKKADSRRGQRRLRLFLGIRAPFLGAWCPGADARAPCALQRSGQLPKVPVLRPAGPTPAGRSRSGPGPWRPCLHCPPAGPAGRRQPFYRVFRCGACLVPWRASLPISGQLECPKNPGKVTHAPQAGKDTVASNASRCSRFRPSRAAASRGSDLGRRRGRSLARGCLGAHGGADRRAWRARHRARHGAGRDAVRRDGAQAAPAQPIQRHRSSASNPPPWIRRRSLFSSRLHAV